MVKFECNGCGKCCVSFGEFIKVERQISAHDYFCRYGITNELFQVHVLPEYADEFADKFEEMEDNGKDASQKGCIFLHRKPDGPGFICVIYPYRPTICKEFLCYRMLIHYHQTGELRGKLIGINELKTHDEILAAIWNEKIAHLPHPFESEHTKVQHSHTPGAEKSHGYESHLLAHINGIQHAEDHEWIKNVITVLAAHGYEGDPVE
ncbi:MAG: YkgJ family cysteine cluster protein [Methanoregula sp.]|nr:YkgJ family cysteine cluster protein [Methanoregula sp.]